MEYPDRVFYHENWIKDCLGCFMSAAIGEPGDSGFVPVTAKGGGSR